MKKIIYGLLSLVACGTVLLACHSSDTVEATSYCYISSFSLGTVKRTMHTTTSQGVDSTYTTSVSASTLRMAIDHRAGTITNVDLLPVGSQLDKIPVTVSANGTVVHASIADTTTWTVYSTKDTLDFTQDVLFRVVASDGNSYRDYTVTVRARQDNSDSYTWQRLKDIDAMQEMTSARLISDVPSDADSVESPVLITSNAKGQCYYGQPVYEKDKSEGLSSMYWSFTPCTGLDADIDVTSTVSYQRRLWMSSASGKLFVADNPTTWNKVVQPQAIRLVAASADALYGCILTDGGYTMAFSADGLSWTPMVMEGSSFKAPLAGVAYTQTNGNRRVLFLADVYEDNTSGPLFAWSLLEGRGEAWLPFNDKDTAYPLPRWQHPTLLTYNHWIMALGDKDRSGEHQALSNIFISHDNGLNWKEDSYLSTPSALCGAEGPVTAMSCGEYVWIIAGTQAWVLRYNSYGEGE